MLADQATSTFRFVRPQEVVMKGLFSGNTALTYDRERYRKKKYCPVAGCRAGAQVKLAWHIQRQHPSITKAHRRDMCKHARVVGAQPRPRPALQHRTQYVLYNITHALYLQGTIHVPDEQCDQKVGSKYIALHL